MRQFGGCYYGKKVLITGHTGFKGSWLLCWLESLGAQVVGVALPPDTFPNHWDLLGIDTPQYLIDIRDAESLSRIVVSERPEIIFHLAAQPLVRRSYRDPLETWSTNVMGTANLLEACRLTDSVCAIVTVTTDKVYENQECRRGYRESDRLGGHDPYSASKAAAELVAESYRKAFFYTGTPLLATARAGNVIGGGDWSEDRLIPDLVRSVDFGVPLEIRSPNASRPWQHVLECLCGYLLLGQKLLEGQREYAEAWNFGPESDSNRTVAEVLDILQPYWMGLNWTVTAQSQPHETTILNLDSTMAKTRLGWHPVWTLQETLAATAEWYHAFKTGNIPISREQLAAFIEAAHLKKNCWVGP